MISMIVNPPAFDPLSSVAFAEEDRPPLECLMMFLMLQCCGSSELIPLPLVFRVGRYMYMMFVNSNLPSRSTR